MAAEDEVDTRGELVGTERGDSSGTDVAEAAAAAVSRLKRPPSAGLVGETTGLPSLRLLEGLVSNAVLTNKDRRAHILSGVFLPSALRLALMTCSGSPQSSRAMA
jgi:hypothetical protein